MNVETLVPLGGLVVGLTIPLAVFYWLYLEQKDKNKTILELSKNIDDPSKVDNLMQLLEERKKQPIDYRRTGVITLLLESAFSCLGSFFLVQS